MGLFDKCYVYTEAKDAIASGMYPYFIPLTGKAMAMSDNVVFVAGTPVVFPEGDIAKAYEGRMGGVLWLADAGNGEKLAEYALPAPPAWDSLAVANGSVFIALTDGRLLCFAGK